MIQPYHDYICVISDPTTYQGFLLLRNSLEAEPSTPPDTIDLQHRQLNGPMTCLLETNHLLQCFSKLERSRPNIQS
ncbi:hypothetical protein TNCV_194421 [Trichonephila clavipes]|nr:hypothetical protein TNCV_194421 [Trichonephila clavipes]